MTLIDHALHIYLEEHQTATGDPLVALMAMSVRQEGQEAAGNQDAAELVPMGEPGADLATLETEVNGEKSPSRTRRKTNRKTGGKAGPSSTTTR